MAALGLHCCVFIAARGLSLVAASRGYSWLRCAGLSLSRPLLLQSTGSRPANAGDTGSSPGLGRSHMPRSNWPRESQLLSLRVWSLCSATREAAIVRGPPTAMKSGPRLRGPRTAMKSKLHSPQLEKAHVQQRRPNTAKIQLIN